MRFQEFNEARRRPDLNQRSSVFEQIKEYVDDPNVFVSFTHIDKLGINPRSKYQTPVGIYCYPLKAAIEQYSIDVKKNGLYNQFPFASTANYFWLFKANNSDPSNMLYLWDTMYKQKQFNNDLQKLKKLFDKTANDDILFDDFVEIASENARFPDNVGCLWNITRCAAADWNPDASSTNPVKWNAIFRAVLGYSAVNDIQGEGIIHPSEPLQAVFFSKDAITPLLRVENKKPSTHITFDNLNDIETQSQWTQLLNQVVGETGNVKKSFVKIALDPSNEPFMLKMIKQKTMFALNILEKVKPSQIPDKIITSLCDQSLTNSVIEKGILLLINKYKNDISTVGKMINSLMNTSLLYHPAPIANVLLDYNTDIINYIGEDNKNELIMQNIDLFPALKKPTKDNCFYLLDMDKSGKYSHLVSPEIKKMYNTEG